MKLSNKSWHVTKIIHLRISTFNLCGNSMMYQPFCTHEDHIISRMWIFLSGPSRSYGNYNVCLSVFPLQQQSLLTSAACLSHFLVGSVIVVLVKYLSARDEYTGVRGSSHLQDIVKFVVIVTKILSKLISLFIYLTLQSNLETTR